MEILTNIPCIWEGNPWGAGVCSSIDGVCLGVIWGLIIGGFGGLVSVVMCSSQSTS